MGAEVRSAGGAGAVVALVFCSACSFGEPASALAEDEAILSFALGVIGTGAMNIDLRFGDGGLDAIDGFASNQGAVQLSSAWIDVEKIDVYAGRSGVPGPVLPPAENTLTASAAPPASIRTQQIEPRHEEDVVPASGVTISTTGRDQFVQPLSAGTFGNGRDSLDVYYYGTPTVALPLPPGGVQSVVVHVRRMSFRGTINGAAFETLYAIASDFAVTPNCAATVNPSQTTQLRLYFDYARLFNNLGGTSSANVDQAFAANIPAGGIMREHECFTF